MWYNYRGKGYRRGRSDTPLESPRLVIGPSVPIMSSPFYLSYHKMYSLSTPCRTVGGYIPERSVI